MSSLTTKETIVLLDKAEYLGTTIRTHKARVTSKLDAVYDGLPAGDGGEGAQRVDWGQVQDSNAGLLETAVQDTRDAGHVHRLNKVKVSQLRQHRNAVIVDIRDRYNSLQLAVTAAYGPDKLEVVGLDAPLVKKYLGVREQCLELVERFRSPDVLERLGEPRANQPPLATNELADGMESDVRRFEEVYGELADMRKILQISMVAKDEAQDDLRRKYVNVARMQEGMFRIVGMDELADRIRVTIPSRPKKDDETREAGAGEADAQGDDAAAADTTPPPSTGEDAAQSGSTKA